MEKKNNSNKIIISVVATAIVVFLVCYIIFGYLPKYKEQVKINDYKKGLYDSIVCQYSCPLTIQTLGNKTQELPEQSCVMQCTSNLRAIQNSTDSIPNSALLNDDLIKDIEKEINTCKTVSVSENPKTKLPELNNTLFFNCSAQGISSLKDKYSYLN